MSEANLAWMRPKLAELCGLGKRVGVQYEDGTGKLDWRPDTSVEQAIRCLEAFEAGMICKTPGQWWYVYLYPPNESHSVSVQAAELPRAICLAIAAAMGWEENAP
jgi:hypothetical protein